jgi:hypothetical protein
VSVRRAPAVTPAAERTGGEIVQYVSNTSKHDLDHTLAMKQKTASDQMT